MYLVIKENILIATLLKRGKKNVDIKFSAHPVVPSGNNTPNDSEVVPRGNNTPNDSEENVRESIVTPEKQTSRKRYITITPRKQAKYVSPPKRIVTRKRKDNPDKWQKNVRKRLRQAGSEYTDTKGKIVEAR